MIRNIEELLEVLERDDVKLTLNEYQVAAMDTCTRNSFTHWYLLLGLSAEVGEVHDKIAKAVRDGLLSSDEDGDLEPNMLDEEYEEWLQDIKLEIGDCLWFIAALANKYGWSLESVAAHNILKLRDRKNRGVISGDGDHR